MEEDDLCQCRTQVFSRVVGYWQPIDQWNDGKMEEYQNRKVYNLNKSLYKKDKVSREAEVYQ